METLNLNDGKIVLLSAKGVKGGKVQLTFVQQVETGKAPTSLVGLLNASDPRFSQSKPRYAWLAAQPEDIKAQFGFDVSDLQEGQILEVGMHNPTISGRELNIQITESTEGDEWQVANFDRAAKRAGKDGDYIMHNGMYIYQRATVVLGEPKHTLLEATGRQEAGNNAIKEALS